MPALDSLEVAVNADRAGFGEIWIGQMATFDAFALAAAAARETEVALGRPACVAVRDPVSLALGITSISHLGGRPAHLALGSSTATIVRDWHGRRWGGNVLLAIGTIERLRPLLRGERSPEGFRLRSPYPGSQLGLAAFGSEMLKVASRRRPARPQPADAGPGRRVPRQPGSRSRSGCRRHWIRVRRPASR